jgi:hypothetical protein
LIFFLLTEVVSALILHLVVRRLVIGLSVQEREASLMFHLHQWLLSRDSLLLEQSLAFLLHGFGGELMDVIEEVVPETIPVQQPQTPIRTSVPELGDSNIISS